MKDRIIIIGASGAVGSTIARSLDALQKYKLILAGRRTVPLEKLKRSFQSDAEIMQVDVAHFDEPGLLKGAALLIMCVDIPDNKIPKACAEQDIRYMDISASREVLHYLEATDAVQGRIKYQCFSALAWRLD